MTEELRNTLAAVGFGVAMMAGFASVIGIVIGGAWGMAWIAAWWRRRGQEDQAG